MLYNELVPAGGPALTTSKMTREQMLEIVACGKFDGGFIMPNYDNDAWVRRTCSGNPAERPPQPGMRMLAPREAEAVVAYIQAVYQGKAMSRAWCLRWFERSPQGRAFVP
ncbi:MAG: hypothetical protein FJX64_09320 [Alphaproteobacteria bacterium]|nr:hypothetical protein [Alphaproteobacteria bacterium]MBM4437935.1 hypothetical protein [Actinomycetota bacterium]